MMILSPSMLSADFSILGEQIKEVEEAGAKWVVVEQDRPSLGKRSMECAAMSRHYLSTLGW